ncbi:hypothetical protein D3C80_1912260 [compost metagenome]
MVLQLIVKGTQLGQLLGQRVDLLTDALGLGRVGFGLLKTLALDPTGHLAEQRSHIFGAHPWQGGFVVAVQIDQTLEGLLFT